MTDGFKLCGLTPEEIEIVEGERQIKRQERRFNFENRYSVK